MSLVDSSRLDVRAGDDAEEAAWFRVKCSVVEQKKSDFGKGYKVQNWVRLVLWNDKDELSATIKTDTTFEGNVVRVTRELAESKGIAFDHAKIIEYAVERLRNKIEYTDIAFSLMPELFTLTELQQVYEEILGRELLKANFRRKISGMVEETDECTKFAGHRPSKMFRYNPNWVEKHFDQTI
jgi:ADP-ribose pyrophosphatase YjhB (NUDIX family)